LAAYRSRQIGKAKPDLPALAFALYTRACCKPKQKKNRVVKINRQPTVLMLAIGCNRRTYETVREKHLYFSP
jgi:hypothetical protein